MNKLALYIFALIAVSALSKPAFFLNEVRSLWGAWKNFNEKTYASVEEELERFEIFYHNHIKISVHNAENNDFKMALNKFADLTEEEFKTKIVGKGLKLKTDSTTSPEDYEVDYSVMDLPDTWNWATEGAVTPVKTQGNCTASWAFSSTGALEGLYYINNNKSLLSFSEQQLINCVTANKGCAGGAISDAFTYTQTAGSETEKDYPYLGVDGQCNYKKHLATTVNAKGYHYVKPQDTDALKTAIVTQPVSVAIEADQKVFQFYSSGVITSGCNDTLNHDVLAVGWTTVNDNEGFIVKNSWGADWGYQGYVQISTNGSANNGNGVCGILTQPLVPDW